MPTFTETDYSRLFELSLDLLCVAGLDGYFKKVNPAWTRTFGWSEAELLARPVAEFMHPEDRERTLQARARLAAGVPLLGFQNRYLCRDGSYRWLSWNSMVDLPEQKVFAVARDITRQRQIDGERIVTSTTEATRLLAGGIAHDLNNVLGSLLLNLELATPRFSSVDEQQSHLQRARQSVFTAESLIRRLLMFAHAAPGVSARRELDLRTLLQEWVRLAVTHAEVRHRDVIDEDLWHVDGDETQLREVVHGLVSNACEAMPGGGVLAIRAENAVLEEGQDPLVPAGRYVRLTIADSGTGIAADVLPKVFGPYFSTKPRSAEKGVGLGLSICRSIVQDHGGVLLLESDHGHGATATIYLPAAPLRPGLPARTNAGAAPSWDRILVMDDDLVFRTNVAEALRQRGLRVEVAQDSVQAVVMFEEAERIGDPFAVALLSLVVRGGPGGIETLMALRARRPGLQAVLMSAFESDEDFRTYGDHGFNAALRKPFSAETLHATVAELLGVR